MKPESDTFTENLPPIRSDNFTQTESVIETYAEWDTWETINALKDAIACFHDVTMIEADEYAYEKFKELKPDIVFNIAEGLNGVNRESQVPAMLDMLRIPYTGSDALTLGICLDKARTKEILSYHNIPNAKFMMADKPEVIPTNNFSYPVIVKPVSEGSSKGIFSSSLVKSHNKLNDEAIKIINKYNQPALIEEFLPGREFTVAIIGNEENAKVLPIIEINYEKFPEGVVPLYSYEAKWILDTKESDFNVFECPAKIDSKLADEITSTALKAYNVLNCKDWSRVDLRLDKNNVPNIIEINPLPGIMPDQNENSSFPKAARAAGMDYNRMIQSVLFAAAERYNLV